MSFTGGTQAGAPRKITHHRALRKQMTPYILLAPLLIFVCFFMLYPIVNVFEMSLQRLIMTKPKNNGFIGFENFVKIFTNDKVFTGSISFTLLWVVLSVAFQCVLGFWLAYLLNQKFKGRGIIRAVTLAPWAVAGLMVGIIWKLILGETYGVFNDLLKKLGILSTNMSWFNSAANAQFSVILANVWRGIPFFTLSFLAALTGIPLELYESSKIDGANSIRTLFSITLPMIKDTIILTTLLRSIWTFNAVDLIMSMTNGGPANSTNTLALYIMNTFKQKMNYGYASALSVVATLIMMVLVVVYLKLGKVGKEGIN